VQQLDYKWKGSSVCAAPLRYTGSQRPAKDRLALSSDNVVAQRAAVNSADKIAFATGPELLQLSLETINLTVYGGTEDVWKQQ
jgi:hypothetical protein